MSETVLAIDVGGTAIKAARLDAGGVQVETTVPTPPAGGPPVVAAIADVISHLREPDTIVVGVAVPGLVSDGVVHFAANLGWREVALRQRLVDLTGLPVAVGHDVTLAARAECADTDGMFVSIGTGIASAEVVGGSVLRGATGRAGELGHVPVWPDGEPCRCGQRGCLETYASAGAIARRYAERGAGQRSAQEIAARRETDAVAAAVWHEAVDALAIALAHEILVRDPAVIVLGGGLANAGASLVEPLREALSHRLVLRGVPELRIARLGALAGRAGAAHLAWELVAAGREWCSA